MNIQESIRSMMIAKRKETFDQSSQLTIGEIILKLEAVKDKTRKIYFEDGVHFPSGFQSWRGSYCELALDYDGGGGTFYEQMKKDCKKDEFGDHHYECHCESKNIESYFEKQPTAEQLLNNAKQIIGKYMVGYKGGDFNVTKNTPVWVACYGSSSGYQENKNGEYKSQAVVDVIEVEDKVIIVSELIDY